MWFLIILLLIILFIAYKTIKVVKQSEVYIIERLGKFHKVADAGLTIIVPFMDRVRSVVSLNNKQWTFHHKELLLKIMLQLL